MSVTTPYLGSKITLVSKAKIRYEGILYSIDIKDSTVALSKVRSLGTEDRPTDRPVAARDEIYEYIIFRGSDIEDLHVCEPYSAVKQTNSLLSNLMEDPAIVKKSASPSSQQMTSTTATTASTMLSNMMQNSKDEKETRERSTSANKPNSRATKQDSSVQVDSHHESAKPSKEQTKERKESRKTLNTQERDMDSRMMNQNQNQQQRNNYDNYNNNNNGQRQQYNHGNDYNNQRMSNDSRRNQIGQQSNNSYNQMPSSQSQQNFRRNNNGMPSQQQLGFERMDNNQRNNNQRYNLRSNTYNQQQRQQLNQSTSFNSSFDSARLDWTSQKNNNNKMNGLMDNFQQQQSRNNQRTRLNPAEKQRKLSQSGEMKPRQDKRQQQTLQTGSPRVNAKDTRATRQQSQQSQQVRRSATNTGATTQQERLKVEPLRFEGEFNFEEANEKFEREIVSEFNDKLKLSEKKLHQKMDKDQQQLDQSVEGVERLEAQDQAHMLMKQKLMDGSSDLSKPMMKDLESLMTKPLYEMTLEETKNFYDKSSSFFDKISCESSEKLQIKPKNWKEERKMNVETFGMIMRQHNDRMNHARNYYRNNNNNNNNQQVNGQQQQQQQPRRSNTHQNLQYRGQDNYQNKPTQSYRNKDTMSSYNNRMPNSQSQVNYKDMQEQRRNGGDYNQSSRQQYGNMTSSQSYQRRPQMLEVDGDMQRNTFNRRYNNVGAR